MTHDASHSYTYDAENRITQVDGGSTATYTYGADGRRFSKTAGGVETDFFYDLSGHVVADYGGGSGITTWHTGHVYVNGQVLAGYFGPTYFYVTDHLGSTRLLTNYNGPSVIECDDYYPFGEQVSCGGTSTTTHKFTGGVYPERSRGKRDAESGLDNAQARYNSSSLGRFMSPDPIGNFVADATNPQTWNLYTYVNNNPLRLIDPSGLECIQADDGNLVDDMQGNPCNIDYTLEILDSGGVSTYTILYGAPQPPVPCSGGCTPTTGGGGGHAGGGPGKPQTPTHPYLTCVANSGNEASLQGLLKLGNSKIAGAFLGNPISDFIQAATGGGGSPAAVDAGLYAATRAAPAVPNVAVSYTSTTITASPSEFSIITNRISAYLPLGDIASGAADVLGAFTKVVQAPIDITASAFGAVTCAAGE